MRSGVQDQLGQDGKTPSLLKATKKISQVHWQVPVPVIPATQESEAGELLKPRRQRLQRAEIVVGDRVRLCLKKNKIKSQTHGCEFQLYHCLSSSATLDKLLNLFELQ